MIQNRWMIPLVFAVVLSVLTVVSFVATGRGEVHSGVVSVSSGEPHVWQQLNLEAGKRYTLKFNPVSHVADGTESVVAATLLQDDGVVFELEDAYWRQRGTWSEGGESGTWEEHNSATKFTFLVPEDGLYDLEFEFVEGRGSSGQRLETSLTWRQPRALTWWPLGIGAILMFGIAIRTHSTRGRAVGKFLERMGEGTQLEIEGVVYTVVARSEHWENRERSAVEFRLRSEDNRERWLAITTYWREHPYIEDGDQYLTQTLIDAPLTPAELARIEALPSDTDHVVVEGKVLDLDRENGGFGNVVTRRNNDVYKTRYTVNVFRDMRKFPTEPGERWAECIIWGPNDEEWSVMQLVDIDTLKLLAIVFAEPITVEEFIKPSVAPDPFGVGHLRKQTARPVQRTQQPFHNQQPFQHPQQAQQQQGRQQQQTSNDQPQSPWSNPDWDS